MSAPVPLTKHFTLEEANRTLPLVRMIVRDIVELHADVHRRRQRLQDLRHGRAPGREGDPYSEEVEEMERELDSDLERLQGYADELAGIGAELKDPTSGLVDFPTLIDDREAYLCWKLGEDTIGFWHDLQSGFAGRQPIPVKAD
jgi:hypothetical protein